MKKIIAVSAGLLLIGSAVAASAEVTFTGDARERLVMMENYAKDGGQTDYSYGRVRLVMNATAKGGAYINTRLVLMYNEFDSSTGAPISPSGTQTGNGYGQNGNANNNSPLTDWAYIGIPIGQVTVNAGRMPDNSSVWFRFDKRADRVAVTWANKMTSVTAQIDKINEAVFDGAPYTGVGAGYTGTEDRDVNQWDLIVKQKFAGDWSMLAYGIYQDDQRRTGTWSALDDINGNTTSGTGFQGTINAQGPAGPVSLYGEFSYAQKNLATADSTWWMSDIAPTFKNGNPVFDNAYGGVVHAKMSFGPADGTLALGFTKNGFQADGNYGFLMMGGAMAGVSPDIPNVGSPITAVGRIGALPSSPGYAADTWFAGFIGDYKVNNMIKLTGILADARVSHYGNLIELSGLVRFDITDGAYINVGAGLLHKSLDKDQNLAAYNPGLTVEGVATDDPTWVSNHNDLDYGVFTELGIKF